MKEPSEFRIENLSAGPLQTNTYLVTSGNESVLIDSGTAHQEIIEKLALSKRKVTAFVMTHGHFDHIMDAMEFKRKLGCKAMIGKGEDEILKWSYSVSSKYMGKGIENIELDRQLADGDLISLGSMGLKIVALPGHTAGSIGILAGSALFTGDALFRGTIGRTDIGGSMELMEETLHKLSLMDENIVVYPGHGPETTIKSEKENNPFLKSIL